MTYPNLVGLLSTAVITHLIRSDASLEDRVRNALDHLIMLKPSDVPETHRGDWNQILDEKAKLDASNAPDVASRIFSMYLELHDRSSQARK